MRSHHRPWQQERRLLIILMVDAAELFLLAFLTQLRLLLPFWLTGVALGSFLRLEGPSNWLRHRVVHLGTSPWAAVSGALLGAISPLCLFGALPLVRALHLAGVPGGALVAFLTASPIINPTLLVMSFALGTPLALARLAAALIAGTLAGYLFSLTSHRHSVPSILSLEDNQSACTRPSCDPSIPRAHHDPTASRPDGPVDAASHETREPAPSCTQGEPRSYWQHLAGNLHFTGKYLLIGSLLAALIDLWFPRDLLLLWLGPENPLAILVAVAVGVPLYVCGGGTIPLIRELLYVGMSPGAAVAFMVSGPATKATNITALYVALGRRWFVLYLLYTLSLAVGLGYLGDLLL